MKLYLEKLLHSMRLLTKPPRYVAPYRATGIKASTGLCRFERLFSSPKRQTALQSDITLWSENSNRLEMLIELHWRRLDQIGDMLADKNHCLEGRRFQFWKMRAIRQIERESVLWSRGYPEGLPLA